MHPSVHEYVAEKVTVYALARTHWKVLDIGGLNVNGSVRDLFAGVYVSLDMRAGPGVDVVGDAHKLPFPAETFDVVTYLEVAEHDSAPWLTLQEAARVLRDGGYLVATARGISYRLHAHPHDYFRFTLDGLRTMIESAAPFHVREVRADPSPRHPGVFAFAERNRRSRQERNG